MKGVIDVDAERARLQKQQNKLQLELSNGQGKLANEKFVNNAPAAVVTKERQRVADLEKMIAQLSEQIVKLDEFS